MKTVIFILLLLAAPLAHAFTPESGLWWNPNQSGRGFSIDVVNEFLVVTAIVYAENDGEPEWYQAAGPMTGKHFEGELTRFFDGQCIPCEQPVEPGRQIGFAGPIEIQFSTETTATVTWQGGELPIQRFVFAYADEWDKMLGEWRMVLDYSEHPNLGDSYPYAADVLVFTRVVDDNDGKDYLGFRPGSTFDRTGNGAGDAAGSYVPESDVHVIVVDNADDTNELLLYLVTATTRSFSGIFEFYDEGEEPTFQGFPVDGFRTRTKGEVLANEQQSKRNVLDDQPASKSSIEHPRAFAPGPVGLKALGKSIDRNRLLETVRELEAQLRQRQ